MCSHEKAGWPGDRDLSFSNRDLCNRAGKGLLKTRIQKQEGGGVGVCSQQSENILLTTGKYIKNGRL